ncbi:MAG: response regulator transcription factor [Bacteroidetes bacterium]|nr:response regulator transcription factor [Bacteroidota bacterium]
MAHNNNLQNIIIADVQFLITTSLKFIIQDNTQYKYVVNSIVTNKNDLFKALDAEGFSMLIIDYTQIDFDGFSVLKKIRKEYPHLSILILTNSVSISELMELNNLNIKNILLKTADKDQILAALVAIKNGMSYYSEEVLHSLQELTKRKDNETKSRLTSAEIEIVRLITEGLTTKQIASKKFKSVHTIMTHRKNIFRKLGLSNSSELVMYAVRTGIIDTIEYYI